VVNNLSILAEETVMDLTRDLAINMEETYPA
jgi:hypothetical protein